VADSVAARVKTLENKPFSSKNESATRGGLGRTVADGMLLPCQNDIRGAKRRQTIAQLTQDRRRYRRGGD